MIAPPKTITTSFGELLKQWRKNRRLSQMNLAATADISTRHLSFVETGKSRPSNQLVMRLARALRLSFRHTNTLLMAAGYAPQFSALALDDEQVGVVQEALNRMLTQHDPFPAVVVNRHYDILMKNEGYARLVELFVDEGVLDKYQNVYRLVFAEDGLRPCFEDWAVVEQNLLARLHEEAMMYQDEALWELLRDCEAIRTSETSTLSSFPPIELPVLSFTLKKADWALRFFSTITTFGTAVDVTVQELRIESLFPADHETKDLIEQGWIGK